MRCKHCGYDLIIAVSLDDRGKNFCPECGKPLRKVPHVPLPPPWEKFEITIVYRDKAMALGKAGCSPYWKFEDSGPVDMLDSLLRQQWEAEVDKRVARNEEIDRINDGQA